MSLSFWTFSPQFEVSQDTIFDETLPYFIKDENTHPKEGERKEQSPMKKRGPPMSNQEMAKMTLPCDGHDVQAPTNALVWILH
jgi:hypothetical protein